MGTILNCPECEGWLLWTIDGMRCQDCGNYIWQSLETADFVGEI